MSAASIADKICTYFGGPYVAATHSYSTPQITVANLGGPILRRGAPKRDDHAADYGQTVAGVPAGCLILVLVERGISSRIAVAGATSGVKHKRWTVRMHCFIRSESSYAEDLQDTMYALEAAIEAHIEADRTCGSGGFEAGFGVGFQVGEGGEPWLRSEFSPVHTTPKELSKGYVLVEFDADEYVQA